MIAGCKSAFELKNIDVSKKENVLVAKEVNVGFAAATLISNLKKKDVVKDNDITTFRKRGFSYVRSTLTKMLEKSPIGSVVCNSKVFNPSIMLKVQFNCYTRS